MAKNADGHPYTSPEDRNKHPLCGAKKKNGGLCRAYAGQNTNHPGTGRCSYHLGNTPTHRQSAVIGEAKRQMATLGRGIDTTPSRALRVALSLTAGHVTWLSAEIGNLDGLESPDARTLVTLYSDERDRLARVAKACLDSGMDEWEVQFQRKHMEALGKVIESAFKAIGGLSQEQRQQFWQAFRLEAAMYQKEASEPELASGD